ncbi:MAG: radical SAM protein [Prevotellaceae bacterium]|jgi:oxygen-independent coproporphyrinogen-3 oxidase|nr:radical SAM protein [Prevotellaceae bacterium]
MYAYTHKRAYRDLGNIDIRQYLHHLADNTNHLYLHLPFCRSKCGFCNLFSLAGASSSDVDKYSDSVEQQLIHYGKPEQVQQARFSSLVAGGRTSLLLNEQQLERMFLSVEKYLPVEADNIYTVIETLPIFSDENKLGLIRNRGVNRISIGIQSFVAEEFKIFGRSHTVKQSNEALERIKKAHFGELNVDLIYGIPQQTIDSVCYSVNEALSYQRKKYLSILYI